MRRMDDNYLTVREVAEKLRTSRHTVYRWIREGRLSAYRLGHEMRVGERALSDFLEERRTDRRESENRSGR